MSGPTDSPPQFAPSRRGYDREQVDEYIAALQSFLVEAEERARIAERTSGRRPSSPLPPLVERSHRIVPVRPAAAPVPFDGAAAEVAEQVAALTGMAADARRRVAAAEEEADRVLGEARAAAGALVAEAEQDATRVRADAEQDAARVRSDAEQAVAAAQEQVVALQQRADQEQARRDETLRHVAALREALAEVPGVSAQRVRAEQAQDETDPFGERTRVIRLTG